MGETLLANGATGGVGTAGLQMGVAVGARVLANARCHHEKLVELGAETVSLEDAAGVDVVLELVGAQNLPGSLAALAPRGRVIIGGTGLSVGVGRVLGSMIGALIMAVLRNGSQQMGWPTYFQEIIIGLVIIVAVFLDRLRHGREG